MTEKDSPHILVFDSGVGGLTIVRALRMLAPTLTVDYCADTAFFPYGDKTDDALIDRLPSLACAIVDRVQPDVFVIACNTASTLALDGVRRALPIPVVGTVPAIKPAAAQTRSGVIVLLATPGTLRRAYTADLLLNFAAGVEVIQFGSVRLVELAEFHAAGQHVSSAQVEDAIRPVLEDPRFQAVDHMVLACTHFPLLRDQLMDILPDSVQIIDSGDAIARQTLKVSSGLNISHSRVRNDPTVWLTSRLATDTLSSRTFANFGFFQTDFISM